MRYVSLCLTHGHALDPSNLECRGPSEYADVEGGSFYFLVGRWFLTGYGFDGIPGCGFGQMPGFASIAGNVFIIPTLYEYHVPNY